MNLQCERDRRKTETFKVDGMKDRKMGGNKISW